MRLGREENELVTAQVKEVSFASWIFDICVGEVVKVPNRSGMGRVIALKNIGVKCI